MENGSDFDPPLQGMSVRTSEIVRPYPDGHYCFSAWCQPLPVLVELCVGASLDVPSSVDARHEVIIMHRPQPRLAARTELLVLKQVAINNLSCIL